MFYSKYFCLNHIILNYKGNIYKTKYFTSNKNQGKPILSLIIALDMDFFSLEKLHFRKLNRFCSATKSSIIVNKSSIVMNYLGTDSIIMNLFLIKNEVWQKAPKLCTLL